MRKKVSPKDFLGPGRQHLVQTALLEGKGAVQQVIYAKAGFPVSSFLFGSQGNDQVIEKEKDSEYSWRQGVTERKDSA